MPSFLKDENELLRLLHQLGLVPPGALLFTADTISMYTNIHTNHAIAVISEWLDSLDLPADYSLGAVKDAMTLVMRNNIF